MFVGELEDESISDDDIPLDCESDDESCPTILLTKEEKRRLRYPWRNALIVKLFDRKLSYEVLMKRLRLKWSLKGDIALTDVGHGFYVVRFNNMEDYDFVLTQGPWLIGDSYLTIRKRVPNFVAEEAPIKTLTAWVRIPHLYVEYFDRNFLMKIGEKIGKVIKINRNTESKDRGQYVRFYIEWDLTKPLLSKFRLNGRVWGIQYEELKQICFKCGHLGHKEDGCAVFGKPADGMGGNPVINQDKPRAASSSNPMTIRPNVTEKYGAWMLVQKPTRRYASKANFDHPKGPTNMDKGKNKVPSVEPRKEGSSNQEVIHSGPEPVHGAGGSGGSRFIFWTQC